MLLPTLENQVFPMFVSHSGLIRPC